MKSQPVIDTGGIRRQVLSDVFKTVAFSDRLGLFFCCCFSIKFLL